MKYFSSNKIKPIIIPICFILSIIFLIITTPIHETTHWILSDIDPTINPTEMHLFNIEDFNSKNILNSALGYIIITEKYPGSFESRLPASDLIQEIICLFIQLLLTISLVYLTILKIIKTYPNIFIEYK